MLLLTFLSQTDSKWAERISLSGRESSFDRSEYAWGFFSAAQRSVGGPQQFFFETEAGADYEFSDGGLITLGQWTDFVFEVNWSSGAINIWRRNQGQTSFTKVVGVMDPTAAQQSDVYFKQGLYRGGNVNGRTDVLWVGPSARGSSFSAVEMAAFGTSNGP